jgi:adenylyltransferase/sulfurtransferase
MEIMHGYDVIIDGTDNFQTRYLTNDACVVPAQANILCSIYQFEGQATVVPPVRGSVLSLHLP